MAGSSCLDTLIAYTFPCFINTHPEKATSIGRSNSGGRKLGGDPSLPASSAGAISRAKSGLPWHVTGYRHLQAMFAGVCRGLRRRLQCCHAQPQTMQPL